MTGLEGTTYLVRLLLRRDRIRIPVWVLALVGITYLTANAVHTAYPNQRAIDAYANALGSSPSAIAMAGPPVALHTIGGVVVYETTFTAVVGTALMVLFLMVRHTRAEEEAGRTELLRSTVVGRHAAGASAFLVATVASWLTGAGIALAVGSAGVATVGALLVGAGVGALGMVFAAITLCLAQVFSHARAATGAALGVLGLAFLLRAAGDVRGDWLVWLSPIGWSQATHPLGEDRWWPLLVSLVATAGLLVLAAVLADRRDLGAGLVAARPGSADASRWLAGPVGLAVRLQRGSLVAWSSGVFVTALVSGSLTREMQDLVRDNPTLASYFEAAGGSLVDSFIGTMLLLLALTAAGFAVSSALRLRAEESAGRVEPLLAASVSRSRWMLGNLLVTGAGSVLVLVAGGLGLGLSYGAIVSDASQPLRIAGLSLVYAPATLVLAALAVLLFGWLPGAARAVWAALGVCFVIGWLGGLLNPPAWLENLSPFTHTPQVPVQDVAAGPLATIALSVVLAVALGVAGFRRRDVS